MHPARSFSMMNQVGRPQGFAPTKFILKWGLIGAGDIAKKRIAPALRNLPNCELVAVSRRRAELAKEFAKEFGARKWYADRRDLVAVLNCGAIEIKTENGERAENHPPHQNFHQPLIEDFIEAVFNDREPLVNGKIGRTIAIIEEEITR